MRSYDGELPDERGSLRLRDEETKGPAALPLYLGFAATGVGVALPGALLPALLVRWHLGDEQGGRLFLMAWIGSSVGALLVRGSLRVKLRLEVWRWRWELRGWGCVEGTWADALMGLYGLGLGMSMTTMSLIRQQQAARSGAEMVRLNLLWAIGACVCPTLTVRALTAGVIRPLLFGVAGCFVLLGLFAVMQREVRLLPAVLPGGEREWKMLRVFRRVPVGLMAMTMLITGIEASAGGWLATYTRRGGHSVADTIAAPTCLWAGLLLSRLFWSTCEERVSRVMTQATIVRGSLALMAVASVLLMAGSSAWVVLVAAFWLGFGIGPTYPMLLAWALHFDRGGAIFFLAGVGSACLPWLTGVISSQQASLRIGLVVPVVGTLVMLGVAMTGAVGAWSREDAKRKSNCVLTPDGRHFVGFGRFACFQDLWKPALCMAMATSGFLAKVFQMKPVRRFSAMRTPMPRSMPRTSGSYQLASGWKASQKP